MHRIFALALAAAAAAVVVCAAPPSRAAERMLITTAPEGRDLRVTVHGVTDYCVTNADTEVLRTSDTIRLVRGRPSHVSRCFTTRDLTFLVANVTPGTYTISYEQIPLVAPARALRLVSATAFVD